MEIMKLMDLMNYNFESNNKSLLYDTYSKFIEANQDILTLEQLDYAETNLLSPNAIDDGKIREEKDYQNARNKIKMCKTTNYEYKRGMAA